MTATAQRSRYVWHKDPRPVSGRYVISLGDGQMVVIERWEKDAGVPEWVVGKVSYDEFAGDDFQVPRDRVEEYLPTLREAKIWGEAKYMPAVEESEESAVRYQWRRQRDWFGNFTGAYTLGLKPDGFILRAEVEKTEETARWEVSIKIEVGDHYVYLPRRRGFKTLTAAKVWFETLALEDRITAEQAVQMVELARAQMTERDALREDMRQKYQAARDAALNELDEQHEQARRAILDWEAEA